MTRSPTLQITTQAVGDTTLLGDVSTGVFPPLVPLQHREAALYTLPGGASDPPPHHSSVLLATDGQGHHPDGQGLPAVPEGQGSQTHTPTTNGDSCTSPPFRPPPRGPGRAAAAFTRPHPPVHHHRQSVEMAGSHPARLHHRRPLRQGPLCRVGVPLRCTSHHHFRQRGLINGAACSTSSTLRRQLTILSPTGWSSGSTGG